MISKRLVVIALSLVVFKSYGQIVEGAQGYYNDALLFSSTNSALGSTARIQGIGGAQSSLGGDVSVISSNPAGIGFFNKSVFSFTPALDFHETSSSYLDNNTSSFSNGFNFANIGAVFYYGNGDYVNSKFKGGSLGVSINRTNNFKNNVSYQGVNAQNSIIDAFIEQAGTTPADNLGGYAYAAFENYLIDPLYDDDGNLVGYGSPVIGNPRQTELIETSGSQYQINVAWGGNYDDFIYFGGGIGIATVNYNRNRTFLEDSYKYVDDNGNLVIDDFINVTEVVDELSIDGAGINAQLGMIVRPVNFITLGVSYLTPTYYSLTDESAFDLYTSWNNVEVTSGDETVVLNEREFLSDISNSTYNLRTPGRLNLGATFFLGKLGFITADVERVNYTSSEISSNDFQVFADNQTIGNLYRSVTNYRTGVEFRLDKFRIRGGFAYYADPYEDATIDVSRRDLSTGIGFRNQDFFLDLAFVNRQFSDQYAPYFVSENQPLTDIDFNSNTVSVTLGFNF